MKLTWEMCIGGKKVKSRKENILVHILIANSNMGACHDSLSTERKSTTPYYDQIQDGKVA